MSNFLEHLTGICGENRKFYELYEDITTNHAKAKALKEWRLSPYAFSFLCEKILMERIRKEIGEDILVETKNLSSSGA